MVEVKLKWNQVLAGRHLPLTLQFHLEISMNTTGDDATTPRNEEEHLSHNVHSENIFHEKRRRNTTVGNESRLCSASASVGLRVAFSPYYGSARTWEEILWV